MHIARPHPPSQGAESNGIGNVEELKLTPGDSEPPARSPPPHTELVSPGAEGCGVWRQRDLEQSPSSTHPRLVT